MTAGELRGLFERVKGGNRLVEADHEFLNKYFGSDWRQNGPGEARVKTLPSHYWRRGRARSTRSKTVRSR